MIRGTRRCPRGHALPAAAQAVWRGITDALLDAGNQAWAAAAGAFPRHFTLTSNRTRDAPLRMDCSGITSCLNLYPTYALTTPGGGPHGTLRQELDLIKTYSLSSTGAAYGAELNALTSAAVSTRYTVRDEGGRAVAQIQKELAGAASTEATRSERLLQGVRGGGRRRGAVEHNPDDDGHRDCRTRTTRELRVSVSQGEQGGAG